MADIDAPLSWRMQQDGYLMQIDQLRTDNAKLRELASRMWRWMERARYDGSVRGHDMDAIAEELSTHGIEVGE